MSCGFQPTYKTGDGKERLLEFDLNFLNGASYETQNIIKSTFQGSQSTALYSINLSVLENQSALVTNSNGTVSKYRVEVIVDFKVNESSSGKIIYTDIPRIIEDTLDASEIISHDDINCILENDLEIRKQTRELIKIKYL